MRTGPARRKNFEKFVRRSVRRADGMRGAKKNYGDGDRDGNGVVVVVVVGGGGGGG